MAAEGKIVCIKQDGTLLYRSLKESLLGTVSKKKREILVFSNGLALLVLKNAKKKNEEVSSLVNTDVLGDAELFCVGEKCLAAFQSEKPMKSLDVASIGTVTWEEYKRAFTLVTGFKKDGVKQVQGRFFWRDLCDKGYFVNVEDLAACKLLARCNGNGKPEFLPVQSVPKGHVEYKGTEKPRGSDHLIVLTNNPELASKIKITRMEDFIGVKIDEGKDQKEGEGSASASASAPPPAAPSSSDAVPSRSTSDLGPPAPPAYDDSAHADIASKSGLYSKDFDD